MTCLCEQCVRDYLSSLVDKVVDEAKEEKERERKKLDERELAEHCGL